MDDDIIAVVETKQPAGNARENQDANLPNTDTGRSVTLRFSQPPLTCHGVMLGSHLESPLQLAKGLFDENHFALSFDPKGQLVLRDWGSTTGTVVQYGISTDEDGKTKQWVLSGCNFTKECGDITVTTPTGGALAIKVNHSRNARSPGYLADVENFRQGRDNESEEGEKLKVFLDQRLRISGANSPPARWVIRVKQAKAKGGFGTIGRFFDTTSGDDYVLKKPNDDEWRDDDYRCELWKREIAFGKTLDHNRIIQVLGWSFKDIPVLKLEYMPLNSLYKRRRDLTRSHVVSIFWQCIDVLEYLHRRKVVHRDVTEKNVLVQEIHSPKIICIRLADFGCSKESAEPVSMIGTELFAAPEMISERVRRCIEGSEERRPYSMKVDVWSLGVMAAGILYQGKFWNSRSSFSESEWPEKIIDHVKLFGKGDKFATFILRHALVLDPSKRSTSEETKKAFREEFTDPDIYSCPCEPIERRKPVEIESFEAVEKDFLEGKKSDGHRKEENGGIQDQHPNDVPAASATLQEAPTTPKAASRIAHLSTHSLVTEERRQAACLAEGLEDIMQEQEWDMSGSETVRARTAIAHAPETSKEATQRTAARRNQSGATAVAGPSESGIGSETERERTSSVNIRSSASLASRSASTVSKKRSAAWTEVDENDDDAAIRDSKRAKTKGEFREEEYYLPHRSKTHR